MNINTAEKILDLISYSIGVIAFIIILILQLRQTKFKIRYIILYIIYIFGIYFYSYNFIQTYNMQYTYIKDFEQLYDKYPHDISNYSSITTTRHYILRFTYKNQQYQCKYYDKHYYKIQDIISKHTDD